MNRYLLVFDWFPPSVSLCSPLILEHCLSPLQIDWSVHMSVDIPYHIPTILLDTVFAHHDTSHYLVVFGTRLKEKRLIHMLLLDSYSMVKMEKSSPTTVAFGNFVAIPNIVFYILLRLYWSIPVFAGTFPSVVGPPVSVLATILDKHPLLDFP